MKTYELEIHYKNQPTQTIFHAAEDQLTAMVEVKEKYENENMLGVISVYTHAI